MSDNIGNLKTLLESFTSPEDMKIASEECKNFLNRVRIQSYPEDAASQALYEAMQSRDRKELNALSQHSKSAVVRDGAKNMYDQLQAKATPTPKWPTL